MINMNQRPSDEPKSSMTIKEEELQALEISLKDLEEQLDSFNDNKKVAELSEQEVKTLGIMRARLVQKINATRSNITQINFAKLAPVVSQEKPQLTETLAQYTLRINTFSIDNLKSELIYVKNQHSNKLREADTLKNNLEKYSEAIKEAEILEKQIALLENRIQKEEKYNTNLWTGQDTDRRADKKAA